MSAVSTAARVRAIFRLAEAPPWVGWAIVGLGLVSAVLEGAGLYLFVPLVQSLSGGPRTTGLASGLLGPVAPGWWTVALVAGLCVSIALKNAVNLVGVYLTRRVEGQVAHRLRMRVFEQTLNSGVDLQPGARLTDIVNTLTVSTWKIGAGLNLCYRVAVCACTIAVFIAIMVLISPPLTLIALAMVGLSGLVVHLLTRQAQDLGSGIVEENKRFGLRMWESIYSLQLIRSFSREAYETRRLEAASEDLRRSMFRVEMLWSAPGPVSEVFGAVLIGALILVGINTGAGLGHLAAFLAVLYRLQGPVREVLQGKVTLEGNDAAVLDVDAFLAATDKPRVLEGPDDAAPIVQGLAFRNVSFRYGEGEPLALSDVSFDVPAGKTTALVGRSGAGKSTVLSMMLRFHDPEAGEVLVDGKDLRQLKVSSWRARLALMAQESQLFNDTVGANIAYGDPAAGAADIMRAAQVAKADAFIESLPQGYDTQVGDRGVRLSGGQKQRIALARAILAKPELLLLDEPTNALDVETEEAFQTALEAFSEGRTVVVIAHRLSTVRRADHIVVFEQGRVVEAGSPEELLGRPGRFARMHNLQTGDPHQREVA